MLSSSDGSQCLLCIYPDSPLSYAARIKRKITLGGIMSFKLKGKSSSLFLILFLFLGGNLLGAAASSRQNNAAMSCNGTSGGCFFGSNVEDEGGDEELLRHYVGGGRWLLQNSMTIVYPVLQPPPVCSNPKYSDCLVQLSKDTRPCADYNRCKRGNPQ